MTFEQLRIFVEVARLEHVTRAAASLGLTQSAVSASIAALEARHSVKLFHRVGRRIELTEAGALFRGEAEAVLARAGAAELALADLGSIARGTVRVHASQTVASYWLPRHLVALRKAHPKVRVDLAIGNTAQVADAVEAGTADLGFVEGDVAFDDLVRRKVGSDRLVMLVGAGHAWSGKTAVAPGELASIAWVLREPGSGTRSEFEEALRQLGIAVEGLDVVMELPSNEAICRAVEAGAGATALSELAAEASLSSGRSRRVALALPERSFHALWHRDRYRTKAALALLELIGEAGRPGAS